MKYEDLFKIKPVLDYDVYNGKIATIIRDEKPVLYVNKEKVQLEGYAKKIDWINRNKMFITVDPNGSEIRKIYLYDHGKIEKIIDNEFDNFSPRETNEGILVISNYDKKTLHLYLHNEGKYIKLSKGEGPVNNYCFNGKYIVYSTGIYDNNIHVIDLSGNEIHVINIPNSEQELANENCFTSPSSFIFLSNHEDLSKVYEFDILKEEIRKIRESDYEIFEAIPYKGSIAYVEDRHGNFVLIHEKEVVNEGFTHSLKVDGDYIYFVNSKHDRSADLYRYGKEVERLTDSMNYVKGDFIKPKVVSYDSNGLRIYALLYEKGDEDKGIVYIHGGPDWECVNSFNPEIQFFMERGFKVICPNYRGSIGYGRRFNHLNDKDPGGGELLDVINSVKVLGVKKIAITGASYGGYLTMMAITKFPDLWCSAVAVVPFVNWFTEKKLEREILQQYDEIKVGSDENLLRDRSPIFFVDRIKAPLLLLAGENDPRCPAEETLQVVEELKKLDREVKYKIYKDEGHGFAKIENYVDSIKEAVEFITSHC
ncbi:S9 family peptidase [Saccharolobus islandicus]|uniref:Acylaminoacyl-peptidase n=1 Tax=Saccharolobus islandicus (strain M.16.4 / Kamchatka \|nr:S9 family peptidase [Sulfolobus islandicus]ACR41204.1 Acylaminoacyl-peptidase [Sulfolobus islandicus M.16.4]